MKQDIENQIRFQKSQLKKKLRELFNEAIAEMYDDLDKDIDHGRGLDLGIGFDKKIELIRKYETAKKVEGELNRILGE